jgi:hypothetical protein
MKLILQIALGVFIGTLTAQLTVDCWHSYRESTVEEESKKQHAEREKARLEQAQRIREMFLESQKNGATEKHPPAGFIPDDAHTEIKQGN